MAEILGNILANNYGLRVFCNNCSNIAELNVEQLAQTYGKDESVIEIGKRCRCEKCQHKGGTVQVIATRWGNE